MAFTIEDIKRYIIASILGVGAEWIRDQNRKLTAGITNTTVRGFTKFLEGIAFQGAADYLKVPYVDTLINLTGILIGAEGLKEVVSVITSRPAPAPAPATATAAAPKVVVVPPRTGARGTVL